MSGIISLFSPYAKFGNIYRVAHQNKHHVSLPRLLRRSWILETPQNKRDAKIFFIVGECSLVQNIQEAIYNGYSVDIITGPKLRNKNIREKLSLLKRNYPNQLTLTVAEERPEKHFCIINGNILYEDPHSDVDNYGCATAVENAEKDNLNLVKRYFEEFKNKRRVRTITTSEEIDALDTIE
jgi:hypothetical protein